jgi:hypothetical protein
MQMAARVDAARNTPRPPTAARRGSPPPRSHRPRSPHRADAKRLPGHPGLWHGREVADGVAPRVSHRPPICAPCHSMPHRAMREQRPRAPQAVVSRPADMSPFRSPEARKPCCGAKAQRNDDPRVRAPRARLDGLLAQQLANRARDRGDRVRTLVSVRAKHDHCPRPPLHPLGTDAWRTRLAGGAVTHLSSHARHPRPETSDTTEGSQALGRPTASKRASAPPVGNLPSASDVTDDANHNSKPRSSGCSHTPGGIRSAQAAHSGQAAYWEVVVTVLRIGAWPGLIVAVMLVVVGLVAGGTAGTMVLAVGFLALLGAGIRLISRNDSPPPRDVFPPVTPASDRSFAAPYLCSCSASSRWRGVGLVGGAGRVRADAQPYLGPRSGVAPGRRHDG